MINLTILTVISANILIAFILGILSTLGIVIIYNRFFRRSLKTLKDLSNVSTSESAPLHTLLNNLPDSIFIKDLSGRYVMANDKFSANFNISEKTEIIGKSDHDFYDKDIADGYAKEDMLILSGEKKEFKRKQKSSKAGKTKHTITQKYPLLDKSKNIIGIVGICSDITDSQNANEQLIAKNEELEKERKLLRTLIDNMPDSIFIKDVNCNFLDANITQVEICKANSREEIIGKCDSDFYPKDIAEIFINDDKQIIKTGVPVINKEEIGFDKDGNIKVRSTTKVPFKDDNGEIIGLVGIGRDITKLKETEEKLIEQAHNLQEINVLLEERQEEIKQQAEELTEQNKILQSEQALLRAIIDNIPDFIYIKDKNSNFITANRHLMNILKVESEEEIKGRTDFDFYPKEMAEKFFKDEQSIIKSGKPVLGTEETGLDIHGNIMHVLTTKVPFKNSSGEILGVVGIGKDITALKETEYKLQEQAEYLKEVNVLLEERQEEVQQQSEELGEQNHALELERNLLRTIIDNLPDFIYIKDKKSNFITANRFLLDLFGVENAEDVKGKSDFDFYPKDMAEKFFNDEQDIIKSGEALIGTEETGLDKDGNIMHVLTTKVPFKNALGDIEGVVGIGKDITALKETEYKLQEQAEYLKEVNVLLEERQEEIQQQSLELSSQNSLLENERNLLRTLIDNLPDSIYIKDDQCRFIIANKPLMEKLSIRNMEDLDGKTDFDFYDKEQALKFNNIEKEILKTKKPVINKEEVRILKSGEKKFRNMSKIPYFDEEGRIMGIVGITKDITELKNYQEKLEKQAEDLKEINQLLEERSEEILKQSEWLSEQNKIVEKEKTLLRALIDNMPDFIYIKDTESRFIALNKRLLNTMKADSEESIIGKTDLELETYKDTAHEYYNDERKIFKTGKPLINKEEIGFDEAGRRKVISTTKVPFKDTDGKIAGLVGIGRDITKQKNTEKKLIEQAESLKEVNVLLEERQEKIQLQAEKLNKQADSLKQANSQLEELNATKNKFFSIIAHDLKNPFQAIFGFSELLLRNFDDFGEDQRVELLGMIKTSSESAYNLLENLLQWARTQTDRIKYSPTYINLQDIVQQNVLLSQANAEKKSININSNLSCSGEAWADFNMVNLIIRNLLSNAIKFTGNDGNITINCKDITDSKCKVSIQDTGIGISQDNIKKLFRIDEYFSTSGTAGENGTGLGLIICKEFIEKNQGKLEVESEINVGTTFSFTLPRKENKKSSK